VLLVAACRAGDGSPPPATSQPNPTVGDVTLIRSGGFAGTTVTITIHPDGLVETVVDNVPQTDVEMRQSDLEHLQALVSGTEFADLSESYIPPDGACCDRFFCEVTAAVGAEVRQSTSADGVETPLVLLEVIELIEAASPAS
jgi:hypothetical protein